MKYTSPISETQHHPDPHPGFPDLDPNACYHCGAIDTPSISAGTGPHAYKATCPHCRGFLRWVSRTSAEERVHRQQQFRREAMAKLLPTTKQLAYLLALGYVGDMPTTREAASSMIDRLRAQGGKS